MNTGDYDRIFAVPVDCYISERMSSKYRLVKKFKTHTERQWLMKNFSNDLMDIWTIQDLSDQVDKISTSWHPANLDLSNGH